MKSVFMLLTLVLAAGCSNDDTEPVNEEENFVEGVLTDIDGNTYGTIETGNLIWMAENLRVTTYRDGSPIKKGYSDNAWETTANGVYAVYDHSQWDAEGIDSAGDMVDMYGKLYNWYAVNNSAGLCPAGWHVPSATEWNALIDYLVGQGYPNESTHEQGAGDALKSCLQINSPLGADCDTSSHPRWDEPPAWGPQHYGFDEYGFSALPAGYRSHEGAYFQLGTFGIWWTSTEDTSSLAWSRGMFSDQGYVGYSQHHGTSKNAGYSVRCVRHIDD